MAGQLSAMLESFRKKTEPARDQIEKWQGEFNSYARKRTEQLYRTVLASPAVFVLLLIVIAAFLGHHGDHRERADYSKDICGEVKQYRLCALITESHQPQQHKACAGDAGITEQPFQVALAQGAQAAVENRGRRHQCQQLP